MKKLVLFDIDGTLMSTDGAGTRSVLSALRQVFDREVSDTGYSMSGKTDTQIVLELMERAGVGRERVTAELPRIWDLYVEGLSREVDAMDPEVFVGVRELLAALSKEDVLLGLLTGNVERGAWIKLRRAGIAGYFRLGAFGDAAPERRLLPQIAVDKAKAETGRTFAGKEIVIIGDTPNDVMCGRHLGVTAVAVATGRFPVEELEAHAPDRAFADFRNTAEAVAGILGAS